MVNLLHFLSVYCQSISFTGSLNSGHLAISLPWLRRRRAGYIDVSCKAVIILAEKFFFHLCSFRSRAIVFRNAGQDVYLESDILVLFKKK